MADFRFTKSHEYIKEDGGAYFLGISEHAQNELGDITFVELPEAGAEISAGDVCCTIESVKAVAEVYAPVNLKIEEANEQLVDAPELINEDAEGKGWLVKVALSDPGALGSMMDRDAYEAMDK